MRRSTITAMLVVAAFATAATAAPDARRAGASDWREFTHPRLGFRISYPADVFVPDASIASEEGLVLVSTDGAAKLLIAAFDNEERTPLDEYRSLVLDRSYPGAKVDYAPVRGNWFVVSGEREGQTFYERVYFSCGGRKITSWALLYPTTEKARYDRFVEAIAPTFRPSTGAAAGC
jgi:hypothetical protein